ncbi:gamma-glutamyl-gamma-aminobutyrate hydrolase family protein [Candidatus Phycosocius spiralis]|uniref:Gamma-glutamyl-gamma-aminobutyrate hydrolase n=1 Tax=Candidatus Phycosocius spiralis TaxID=2815099 RepID=A0ABQ4PVH3_9PROT|nr:gamma-glutamyl-gamma-aminobutyrate hydrolase family protein [Candidatus Phycosocius spiralis]GIU66979.1 gamma-glutamyl-gamma-aminobutyrate hydrolase [Candidatus Phycosocius spiralis]
MTARPILGMICCQRHVGTEYAQAVMERYLYGVSPYVDAIPMLIPSLPDFADAEIIAHRLEGLLLTGSPSNMEPHCYGEVVEDAPGPFDPKRDEMAIKLADAMLKLGKPVFGICRGFQELNVHFGGTLRRDLSDPARAFQHHAPDGVSFDAMFDHTHSVTLEEGGTILAAIGKAEIEVNSVHYQGVDKLGTDLRVEARASDGVVEAFSSTARGGPVLAVQWHPEWKPEAHENSRKLFGLMGRVLRGGTL